MGSGLDTTPGTMRFRRKLLDLWAVLWVDCGVRVSFRLVGVAWVHIRRAMEFTYPILLEAILRAEKAILDIKLQARRALQSASLVGAVGADAHALLLSSCGHIAGDRA
jgi:hypothetical protein